MRNIQDQKRTFYHFAAVPTENDHIPASFRHVGITPDQWKVIYDKSQLSGEVLLVLATVEDGLRCCRGEVNACGGSSRKVQVDLANKWLRSDSTEPFSFLWCCDILNLEPSYIRAQIFTRSIEPRTRRIASTSHFNHGLIFSFTEPESPTLELTYPEVE